MLDAGSGDLGTVNIERLQLSQAFDVLKPGVPHVAADKIEFLEIQIFLPSRMPPTLARAGCRIDADCLRSTSANSYLVTSRSPAAIGMLVELPLEPSHPDSPVASALQAIEGQTAPAVLQVEWH